jgi:hypothetical protein
MPNRIVRNLGATPPDLWAPDIRYPLNLAETSGAVHLPDEGPGAYGCVCILVPSLVVCVPIEARWCPRRGPVSAPLCGPHVMTPG